MNVKKDTNIIENFTDVNMLMMFVQSDKPMIKKIKDVPIVIKLVELVKFRVKEIFAMTAYPVIFLIYNSILLPIDVEHVMIIFVLNVTGTDFAINAKKAML